ncbi:MAG: hypothetical protein WBG50_12805 [Desulfomonilaceae bacterium]
MTRIGASFVAFLFFAPCLVGPLDCAYSAEEGGGSLVCPPTLAPARTIELGKAGVFKWTCSGGDQKGNGFYIVFIRPAGTYVLLKVPVGKTSFEFTPDVPGLWRWIVINTDPDRAKPDVESKPGYFHVLSEAEPEP